MKNSYEIRGDITIIHLGIKHGRSFETIIETKDLPRALEFPAKWYADNGCKSGKYYVRGYARTPDGRSTSVSFHRWMLGFPVLQIDHINHDTLDNRRSNLREVTNKENCQNRKGAYRNSKTGIRGVFLCKRSNRWIVQVAGKYIGSYVSVEEADEVARKSRAKYMAFSSEAIAN